MLVDYICYILLHFTLFYLCSCPSSRSRGSSQQMNLMELEKNCDVKADYKRREHCEVWKGDIWDQDIGNQRYYFRTYPYIFPRHQESKKELPYFFFIFFTFSSYSTYSFQLIHFCFMFLYHVFTFKIHSLPIFFSNFPS